MTERANMKEFTKFAVPRSFLPELQFSFFLHIKHKVVLGAYSDRFRKKIGTVEHGVPNTPKE